jgi:RNA polymerase sigma-70 factor (ECF subfamily)
MDKRRAFEETAVPFLRVVHAAALRLTRDREDARDCVQETMLRAFRTFESFTPGTNCKAWLLKILYTVFVNRYHKARRDPPTVELEERLHHASAATEALPGSWEREEWSEQVEEALGRLPETFRAAVLLVDVEELTYEETADALDCPVGTVRSRVARGRRMLYAALADHARQRGLLKVTPS